MSQVWQGLSDRISSALDSRGWQTASKKLLKNGHAEHIHAHCDCEFAVRSHSGTSVAGYDPEKHLKQYRDAGSDMNAMRRIDYAARKDAINAQKRAAYAARKTLPQIPNFNPLPEERVVEVLRKEAQSWIASLSDAERTAIQKYTYNPGDQNQTVSLNESTECFAAIQKKIPICVCTPRGFPTH